MSGNNTASGFSSRRFRSRSRRITAPDGSFRGVVAGAIRLARDGFAVDGRYARIAKLRENFLRKQPEALRVLLADGQALKQGYVLKQPDLVPHPIQQQVNLITQLAQAIPPYSKP